MEKMPFSLEFNAVKIPHVIKKGGTNASSIKSAVLYEQPNEATIESFYTRFYAESLKHLGEIADQKGLLVDKVGVNINLKEKVNLFLWEDTYIPINLILDLKKVHKAITGHDLKEVVPPYNCISKDLQDLRYPEMGSETPYSYELTYDYWVKDRVDLVPVITVTKWVTGQVTTPFEWYIEQVIKNYKYLSLSASRCWLHLDTLRTPVKIF
jgi:hypothetical protein